MARINIMKRLCVFCGSAKGNSNIYVEQAKKVGEFLAKSKIGLVYGGGNVGIMGILADTVMANDGDVTGVIPKSLLEREVAHQKITKLHVVEGMHERKRMMYDFSDSFLVLPGGMGTLDEMFEILTWSQLKLHTKPIYLLNEFGFYDHLLKYIEHSHTEGFIKKEHTDLIRVLNKIEDIF